MTRACPRPAPPGAAEEAFTAPGLREPLDPFRGAAFAGGREVATRTHADRREET